jgi:phosphoglycolate phosphatase
VDCENVAYVFGTSLGTGSGWLFSARMSLIRLAVVDMAGTTVRDDGVVERAFNAALASLGTPAPVNLPERFARGRGGSKLAMFMDALGGYAERARTAHDAFETSLVAALDQGELTPMEGAEAALQELHSLGIKIVLTTGLGRRVRDVLIARLGWAPLVDLVLSPEDAGRGRPYPDLVLTALLRLEVDDVRQVAVVGDTANDLVAGTRAGASIVAGVLTGAHGRDELERAPHTHLIDSIAQFPALIRAAGQSPPL